MLPRIMTVDMVYCRSALTERLNLATNPALYANGGQGLKNYLLGREATAFSLGRYNYGQLEFPYSFTVLPPDFTIKPNQFPPGTYHQDSFSGNPQLLDFYLNTLIPLFNSTTSFYFHLTNSTHNDDATLNLDTTILALLSHRYVVSPRFSPL